MKWPYLALSLWCSVAYLSVYGQKDYHKEYQEWQSSRLASLKSPYGWTSVVGLYTIEGDDLTFGSDEYNDLVFPDHAPAKMGHINKANGEYYITFLPGINAYHIDTLIEGALQLNPNADGPPTMIHYQSMQWFLMDRQGKKFVRLRDTLSPYRALLKDIPTYDIKQENIIQGTFTKATAQDSITYNTAIGIPYTVAVSGYIDFQLGGTQLQLVALPNGSSSYFIILGDQTSGDETYGGGRFMYVPKEDATGTITLDFNKTINPPCVFTPYATCPLPPEENILPIKIEAGEKMLYLIPK